MSIDAVEDIDSADRVIFDLDQLYLVEADFVEIPVFIESDDIINTLDFSMAINTENLRFESVIDHTGELQFAAFLNPNDLKLRFTSNSFSPYPMIPLKVVSIRFKVLSGIIHRSDMLMIVSYLNGEPCTAELLGDDFPLSNKDVITNETFITPNPAADFIYIESDEEGLLDMFDIQGRAVVHNMNINSHEVNRIDVQKLPRGSYTVRIVSNDHTVKVQKIVLQ